MRGTNYIRFDWAIKKLLRQKANFVVLEGFLTVLLRENIRIKTILESEGNQEEEDDKFNRVDILAENEKGELIIIEVQNTRELAYFHRMLYGVSKAICEHIKLGDDYEKVKKVYAISIVYLDAGQGKGFAYRGKTDFRNMYEEDDILSLTESQKTLFQKHYPGDILPEYYILKVNDFDKTAKDSLQEWIYFLKTSIIPDDATAPGLKEARTILAENNMTPAEKAAYERHIDNLRYQKSLFNTQKFEGRAEREIEIVLNAVKMEMPIGDIMKLTGLSKEQIDEIVKNKNKELSNSKY